LKPLNNDILENKKIKGKNVSIIMTETFFIIN
jgi:hypothetical protein